MSCIITSLILLTVSSRRMNMGAEAPGGRFLSRRYADDNNLHHSSVQPFHITYCIFRFLVVVQGDKLL